MTVRSNMKKALSFKRAIEAMRNRDARLVKMYANSAGDSGSVHYVIPGGIC
jgi:hypothetical protein